MVDPTKFTIKEMRQIRQNVQTSAPGQGTCLAIHTPGTSCGKRNCGGHGVSSVVARASRPCESCNQHTGETPVPGVWTFCASGASPLSETLSETLSDQPFTAG